MSFINFLIHGTDGQQESYRRDSYPKDSKITILKNIDSFSGNITHVVRENDKKTVYIDDAYVFAVLPDNKREECEIFWEQLKGSATFTCITVGICAALAATCAIAGAILLPTLFFTIEISVLAVALLGISLFANHRANQAEEQQNLWSDPLDYYIGQCRLHHETRKIDSEINKPVDEHAVQNEKYIQEVKGKIEEFIKQLRDLETQMIKFQNENKPSFASEQLKKIDEEISSIQDKLTKETDPLELNKLNAGLSNFNKIKERLELIHVQPKRDFVSEFAPYKASTLNSLKETLKLYITLKAVTKQKVVELLQPYLEEYPDLKQAVA